MKKKTKSTTNKNRWSELSKELRCNNPACEMCKAIEHLQVHHIISKYYLKSLFRFDKRNLIVLCPKCHFKFHKNPIGTIDWFANNRADDYIYLITILREKKDIS